MEVFASGLFDLNGNRDVMGEDLSLHVTPAGAGDVNIGSGGILTVNANTNVYTIGTGSLAGATIAGGTFALQIFGTIAAAGTRALQVNDGAAGDDLTITSAVTDGTGLQSVGIVKSGFGTLVLGGITANTLTGTTTVNEGTLVFDKGSGGAGGVNALSGPLTIGDGNVTNGYAGADRVVWRQPDQLPDYLAAVTINAPGLMELNGKSETIGNVDAQTSLTVICGSVATGAGTLTINGNIAFTANQGVALWTPVFAPVMSGKLNLGSVVRGIDIADRSELPYDAVLTAEISGIGGINKTGSGMLFFGGNNTYGGSTFLTAGGLAAGSDPAFGTSRVYFPTNDTQFIGVGGRRTLVNEFYLSGNTFRLAGRNVLGGGGNALKFTGPVNLNGGTATLDVPVAASVEFAGGVGELFGNSALTKSGFGTLIFSADSPYSGATAIATNGGTIVLTENGAARNTAVTVNVGGVLQVGDLGSAVNLADRLSDTATTTLAGGTLALVGKAGAAAGEMLGPITLATGTSSTIQSAVSPAGGLSSARWDVLTVSRTANQGALLRFQGLGVDLGATTANRMAFLAPGIGVGASVALDDGIIPYAVISNPSTGLEFATWVNNATPTSPSTAPFDNFLTPLTSGANFATDNLAAGATVNVKVTSDQAVAAATTVNAVLIAGSNVDLTGAGDLTLNSGLLAVSGTNNTVSAATLTMGTTEGLIYSAAGADENISSAVAGASNVLGKGGPGAVTISGANASTFTGTAWVTEGTYRAQKSTAFGTTAGNVEVQFGATVEVSGGLTIPAESLTLRGNGESNVAAIPLRNVAGSNVWQGAVNLGSNRTGIDLATSSELIVNGVVSNQGLNKFGGGTLELGGTAANTFVQSSIVWQGTLELNKTAGVNAIPALNDNTEFYVGNSYGTDNSATLKLLADNQIADGSFRLRIMPTGLLDLNGRLETILGRVGAGNNHDVLGLDISAVASGDVDLNGGTLRLSNTIADNGRVQVRIQNGGLPTAATISDGTLELQGGTAMIRKIFVDDSTAVEDLVISATIADGGVVGTLQKDSPGRLVLAPSAGGGNAYTAPTIINGGEVVVRHANALGTTAGNTTVNTGFSLLVDSVGSAEPLNLIGTGYGGRGAVVNLAGTNTWSGAVTLAGATSFGVEDATKLILSGAIGQSAASNLNKVLNGTLQFAGSTSNTYTGTTQVQDGVLELNKSSAAIAIAGRIEAGNDSGIAGAGGAGVDVVKWLQSEQLGASEQLVANTEGLFDLSGQTEAVVNNIVNAVFTRLGPSSSGRFDLNGGALIMQGGTTQSIGATVTGTTVTASPSSAIEDGTLQLRTTTGLIDVADSLALNDLTISVTIDNDTNNDGTFEGFITKNGAGTLTITSDNSGANVYGGTGALATVFNAGTVAFGHSNALGGAAVTVAAASAIRAEGGSRTIPNSFSLTAAAGNLTVRGDQGVTLGGTILNSGTVADHQLLFNTNVAVSPVVTGTIQLTDTATARTILLRNNTFGTLVDIQGPIVNGVAPSGALDTGGNAVVKLSNTANTFSHDVRVQSGILRIAGWGSLNAAATNSIFLNGGALEVPASAGAAGTRPFSITSAGFNAPTGGLRIVDDNSASAQTVTINTNVVLAGNAYLGVEGAADALVLGGTGVISGAFTLTKVGAGTLELAGGAWTEAGDTGNALSAWALNGVTSANTNAGTLYYKLTVATGTATVDVYRDAAATLLVASGSGPVGATFALTTQNNSALSGSVDVTAGAVSDTDVSANTLLGPNVFGLAVVPGTAIAQGAVRLNKNAGFSATGAGWIKVGDEGGGDGADRLVWAASDQLHDALLITVGSSGRLDVGGNSDTIGSLVLNRNGSQSADVAVGAGGVLTLAGNTSLPATIQVANYGLADGSTPAATLTGPGTLRLTESAPTIVVADSVVASAADDLTVSAPLGGTYSGTATTFAPGLREARTGSNSFDETTFGTRTTPKLYPETGETTDKGPWVDNDSWIYSGQIYDADGVFAFAGGIDDNFEVLVDGQRVLRHGGNNIAQTGSTLNRDGAVGNAYGGIVNFGLGPRGDGWHDVEFRITQGGGGAGPYVSGWGWLNSTYGFGYTSNPSTALNAGWWGQNYIIPFGSTTPTDGALRYAAGSTVAGQIGSIVSMGTGTLNLTVTPTANAPVDVQGGILRVSEAAGTLANAPAISIGSGGMLMLDNQTSVAAGGRVGDSTPITLAGGTLALVGNPATPVTEDVGTITLNPPLAASLGANAIGTAIVGAPVLLQADILVRNAGATVSFVGAGAHLDAAVNAIKFDAVPAEVVGGILPYATTGLDTNYDAVPETIDLVTDVDPGTSYAVGRLTTYDASNVRVTANAALSGTINALLIAGNAITVDTSGGLTIASGQVVNTGGSNTMGSGGIDFGSAGPLIFVEPAAALNIGGPLTATADLRKERAGTLVLSADNSGFSGAITVVQGSLTASHANALGGTAAGTTVYGGASLYINGVIIPAEPLTLYGSGPKGSGTLASGGTSSLAGNVTLAGGPAVINVTSSALELSGSVLGRGVGLTKLGAGTLVFSGATSNGYTGPTTVAEGTLQLNKSGAAVAIPGNLFIGDMAGSDVLQYGSAAGGDQINALRVAGAEAGDTGTAPGLMRSWIFTGANKLNTDDANNRVYWKLDVDAPVAGQTTVSIYKDSAGTLLVAEGVIATPLTGVYATVVLNEQNSSGLSGSVVLFGTGLADDTTISANTLTFDTSVGVFVHTGGTFDLATNNKSESIGPLLMTGGNVATGTGTLTVTNNLVYSAGGPAVINGNLNLGGFTRNVHVYDGASLNDLTVNAPITNGRLNKTDAGLLLLTNANSFLAGTNETQRITFAGSPTGGTTKFTLNFNGNVTGIISYDATGATTAANIDTALELLPNIGIGNVTVAAVSALVFDVTFTGHLGAANIPNLMTGAITTTPGTVTIAEQTAGLAGVAVTGGTLAVGDNAALGTARLHINGSGQLLPAGGDRTLANDVTLHNNTTVTFGGRRDVDGTYDLSLTGGVTLHSSVATGQTVNLDVNDPQTLVTMSGVISGGGNFLVPTKRGVGTLVWSGNNTFDVRNYVAAATLTSNDGLRVEGGVLRVAHSNALGTSAELATVNVSGQNGAVLEIDGSAAAVNITGRILELVTPDNGTSRGYLNRSAAEAVHTGVLRNIAGDNSITSAQIRLRNIADNANAGTMYIGADAGSLNLIGAIIGLENDATPTAANNRTLYKVGGGTLTLGGTTANTVTGNTAVLAGTLQLNKTGAVIAIAGPLYVGDNVGGDNADRVVYVAGAGTDQIGTVVVNVGTSGLLDFASVLGDTVGVLTLTVGDSYSGDVTSGASGSIRGSNYAVAVRPGIAAAVAATMSGKVDLGGAVKVFNVADGPGDVGLNVTADLGETTASGIDKQGAGRMVLNPATGNTFTGTATVTAGALRVQQSSALGTAAGLTTVANGGVLELDGTGLSLADALTVSGSGVVNGPVTTGVTSLLGTGGLRNLQGTNTWAGNVTIGATNTLLAVGNGTLNLSGVVAFGNNLNSVKSGSGTLQLSGTGANTFTTTRGTFYVNEGTLLLDKNGQIAMPINVAVGDGRGANDLVQYTTGATGNEIDDAASVSVLSTGKLDLATNNKSDTVWYLNLGIGPSASGSVATGGGTLGLNAGNGLGTTVDVATLVMAGTTAAASPATIDGKLSLNNGNRFFGVRKSLAPVELTVSAVISNGAGTIPGSVGKTGVGTLLLSAVNTYTGPTDIKEGTVVVTADGALGTVGGTAGTSTSGTTVNFGATLAVQGSINYSSPEMLLLSGPGVGGNGALRNVSGNNLLSGNLVLGGPTLITSATASTSLTVNGTVEANYPLLVSGAGDTAINGAIAASGYIPGWREGQVFGGTGADNTTVNSGSAYVLVPRWANYYGTAFPTTTTYIYTGQLYDDDGSFSLAYGPQDDWGALGTDGVSRVTGGGPLSTGLAGLPLPAGWTPVEVRVGNNGGPGGCFGNQPGWGVGYGVGYSTTATTSTDGSQYLTADSSLYPTLFRTAAVDANPSLTKTGTGSLTLSGNNTYNGPTTVNGGTLLVDNATGSGTGTGNITVNNGATLGGTGALGGTVTLHNITSGTTLSPGDPTSGPADLATGSLTLSSGSTFVVQLNGPAAGTEYDTVAVTGNVALNGAMLDAARLVSYTPAAGTTFTLIDNDDTDAVTGTFAGLAEGTLLNLSRVNFRISYADGTGNDVVLTTVNLPPTVALQNTVTTLAENAVTTPRIKVADIVISDDLLGTAVLSLSGADAALFEIAGAVLYLKAGTALNFETNPVLDVTVEVDDTTVGATPDEAEPLAITITDVNEPPALALTNTLTTLAENAVTTPRIKVADIVVTDDALGTNVLSLSGADAALFEIDGAALYLKAGTALDFETNPVLDVTVVVDDTTVGATPDDTEALASSITDVNEPPMVALNATVTALAENAVTTPRIKVADIVVTDDALGVNVLSLSGADAALFEIDGSELYLKAGTVLDFESNPVLDVTVEVDDTTVGATPDDAEALAITVTDVNEPPTVTLANTVTALAENAVTTPRIKAADIVIIDDALGTNVLSLSGADAILFEIDGAELYLKAGAALDLETNPVLGVTVAVDDTVVGATPDDTEALAISITDFNEPPTVALINTVTTLAENAVTTPRIKVADIVVTDDALGVNVLSLSGADAALFEIAGTELYLKAGTVLDFETNPVLDVIVEVDDTTVGATPDDAKALAITVTDINEPPTVALTNTMTTLAENAVTTPRIKVADIVVSDDALGTNVLSLSGADAALFEIDGSVLYLKAGTVLDAGANPVLDVTVAVDDTTVGVTPDDAKALAIAVSANAPPAVSLTNTVTTLAENAVTTPRVKVADIVITDDALGTNVLSLSGADAALFEIDGAVLYLKVGTLLDFETNPVLDVTVAVDDTTVGAAPDDAEALAISITDVNEPPAVALTNRVTTLAENAVTTPRIKVADIVITDDALGSNVLSLSGADAGLFEIVGAALYLKAGTVLDFETNPVLDVTVAVDDTTVGATPDDTEGLVITVTDVNEPSAVALTNTVTTLAENAVTAPRIKVADIVLTDDALGCNVLSLSGADAALFEIAGSVLYLKAGTVLDFETDPVLDVTVAVDDTTVGATPDDAEALAIGITDVNEAPAVGLTNTVTTLAEDAVTTPRIKVADIVLTDDALGSNVLSLSGVDAALFEIAGSELYLKAGSVLDFEANPMLDVTVAVDDTAVGAMPDDAEALAIGITDVNEPPMAAAGGPYVINASDSLNLNGTGSFDPDLPPDSIVSYEWDFDSDGTYEYTGVSPTVPWASLSSRPFDTAIPITLRVTDSHGAAGTQVTTLTIRDNRPSVIRYDFGISGSPVQAAFVGVVPQDIYSATRGYGWMSRVAGADRKDPKMSDLRRDLIYARDATFKVNLDPTKTYSIRIYHANPKGYGTVSYVDAIYQGNPSASGSISYVADNFNVSVEGIVKYNVAVVPAGGTVVRTISNVTVSADGVLELRFRDLGGQDSNFVVSALEISAGALPAETPLLAEGDPRDEDAAAVSVSQLQPVIAEAIARWSATGLTADQSAALSQTQFVVADLGAAYLGLANPAINQIRIDDDAAKLGWSVVSGQWSFASGQWGESSAGTTDDGPRTTSGVDLLTVVMHEMGHLLGYGHSEYAEDLMSPVLSARGSTAEADQRLGPAEWRSGMGFQYGSDALFADLADDDSIGAWRIGRVRHDEEDTSAELLESGESDLLRPEAAASPAEETFQSRVPRRSRLQRHERELDAWFDGLARETGDLQAGVQS